MNLLEDTSPSKKARVAAAVASVASVASPDSASASENLNLHSAAASPTRAESEEVFEEVAVFEDERKQVKQEVVVKQEVAVEKTGSKLRLKPKPKIKVNSSWSKEVGPNFCPAPSKEVAPAPLQPAMKPKPLRVPRPILSSTPVPDSQMMTKAEAGHAKHGTWMACWEPESEPHWQTKLEGS